MWEAIRGYLTFTRKERYGVLFLLLVIGLLFILPHLFKPAVGDADPVAYNKLEKETIQLDNRLRDSASISVIHERYEYRKDNVQESGHGRREDQVSVQMFDFDPNRINAADWQRLGLSPRLSQTIIHYREKGGQFHRPEDLKKIYGIHSRDYERLLPYIKIAENRDDSHKRRHADSKTVFSKIPPGNTDSLFREKLETKSIKFARAGKNPEMTEINQADSTAWCRFPGIGAKLASRIVNFRGRLGGFYNIDQVGETFGLPDSVFKRMKYYLQLSTDRVNQIDINSAGAEVLQAHPYIRWRLAQMIVGYRNHHGMYHAVDELLRLPLMDSVLFKKIKPYIVVK